MRKNLFLVASLVGIVTLSGCSLNLAKTTKPSSFVFEQTEFDFGPVKQSTGKVPHDFAFTYQGNQPIDITALPTSCGCTTAVANKTHLVKGDQGIITVTFNPNHHAEPKGKFFRTVSIVTSPKTSTPELKIWTSVVMDIGPQIFEMSQPDND
jgi:hypothetical protein